MEQHKQAAAIALEFLKRTEIKGSEWRTFGQVIQFLESVAQGVLVVNDPQPVPAVADALAMIRVAKNGPAPADTETPPG